MLAGLFRLKQPRVLDGNYGLVGECLKQLDLPPRKASDLRSCHADCTNRAAAFEHRNRHDATITGRLCPDQMLIIGIPFDVGDFLNRSEERRVGKECRSWWSSDV